LFRAQLCGKAPEKYIVSRAHSARFASFPTFIPNNTKRTWLYAEAARQASAVSVLDGETCGVVKSLADTPLCREHARATTVRFFSHTDLDLDLD
jgi:hypothetical protein